MKNGIETSVEIYSASNKTEPTSNICSKIVIDKGKCHWLQDSGRDKVNRDFFKATKLFEMAFK